MIGRKKTQPQFDELEDLTLTSNNISPPPQASATSIYGWGAGIAEMMGVAPAEAPKTRPASPANRFDSAQEHHEVRESGASLLDEDAEFDPFNLKRKISRAKSPSRSEYKSKKKSTKDKESRDKRNTQKQEEKRAQGFISKSSSRSQSRSRSRERGTFVGGLPFLRNNGNEERDTRIPSFSDDSDVDVKTRRSTRTHKSKNAKSGPSPVAVTRKRSSSLSRGRSKNKARAKAKAAKEAASPRSQVGSPWSQNRSRSKSRSARRGKHFLFDEEEIESKDDHKKDKNKGKSKKKGTKEKKEDDAYDKVQNMLGVTCGVSSCCAVGAIIALHLL